MRFGVDVFRYLGPRVFDRREPLAKLRSTFENIAGEAGA